MQIVYCFWRLHTIGNIFPSVSYTVVSDGCQDMFINCHQFQDLIIAGTADKAFTLTFDYEFDYFGIRFFPGYATNFFTINAGEIANTIVSGEEAGKFIKELHEKLYNAVSHQQRIEIAQMFLPNRLSQHSKAEDIRFTRALYQILASHGNA